MAEFTKTEILNALSQAFRAQVDLTKTGGTLDTDTEYAQLKEMVSITFLLHQEAIFYLARLVANRLVRRTIRELDLIEDMLVALDNLGQVGEPFRNTALLSDANTALLSLDAATSVTNRPEADRFNRIMDNVASQLRKNVISNSGQLVRPREEARNVIRADLEQLKLNHDALLVTLYALRDLLGTYLSLDIPSKVSTNAFANIRASLETSVNTLDSANDSDNIAASRDLLLSTLTNKAVVSVIDSFSNPSNIKYRSPNQPVPSDLKHTGFAGSCTPAAMVSARAPWDLPQTEPIVISVDGGAGQSVDLQQVTGPLLLSVNDGPFEIQVGAEQLHVVVDPTTTQRVGTVPGPSFNTITLDATPGPLRFKHLGTPFSVIDFIGDMYTPQVTNPADLDHRTFVDFHTLQVLNVGVPLFNPTYVFGGTTYYNVIDVGTASAGAEGALGLKAAHIGDYFELSGVGRFEILNVLTGSPTASLAVIDPRDKSAAILAYGGGTVNLRGSSDLSTVGADIAPSYSVALTSKLFQVSTAIKTVTLTTGTRTISDIIADITAGAGVFESSQVGATLFHHVRPIEVKGRLALVPRSTQSMTVDFQFLKVPIAVPGPATWIEDSGHVSLGYSNGQSLNTRFDSTDMLLAPDLAELIEHYVAGVTTEVLQETVLTGISMSALGGTKLVEDLSADFVTSGVVAGDLLEITGAEGRTYRIEVVATTQLTLKKNVVFAGNETGLAYTVLKERVQVTSDDETRSTSIEFVSGPAVIGFSSSVQYGSSLEFAAEDPVGNRLTFDLAKDTDVLKLPGRTPIEVESVQGTTLLLEETVPSNLSTPFTIRSRTGEQYDLLRKDLETFTSSRVLLQRNGFDESLDELDAALTAALIPGRNFASSRNNARRILVDLAELMGTSFQRSDEHGLTLVAASLNIQSMVEPFRPITVPSLDLVVQTFRERKFDRAVDLMLNGDLDSFYDTTSETGSYAGTMMDASRVAVADLPPPSSNQEDVDDFTNIATGRAELTDPDIDFSDTDDEFEVEDA